MRAEKRIYRQGMREERERERGEREAVRKNVWGLKGSVVIYSISFKNRHREAWSWHHDCTTTRLMAQVDMSYYRASGSFSFSILAI